MSTARTILLQLARGEISLTQATNALDLPDVGHTLRAMAAAGLTPHQLPDKEAQYQAIAGLDALRAAIKPVRGLKARITRGENEELIATFPSGSEVVGTLEEIVAALRRCAVDAKDVTMPDKLADDSPTTGQRIALYAALKRIVPIGPEGLIDRDDFATAAQMEEKVTKEQLEQWRHAGDIFAVEHNGIDFYPIYGFDTEPSFAPRRVLRQIIAALDMPASHIAVWFMAGCSMLDSRRPQDLLESNPDAVLAAAISQGRGITHG